MSDPGSPRISRRQWLGLVSPPALAAASIGAGLAGGAGRAAGAEADPAAGNDRGARVYNPRDFGARGDGTTLDTRAVQAAIDACHGDGGGAVVVPAGDFLIGTVELKTNVALRVSAGGRLLGSGDGRHYHAVDAIPLHGDATLEDGNWALIFAVGAKNVSVEGPGTIDGQGIRFHSPRKGTPPPSGLGGNRRPYLLLFYGCENLAVRDIELVRSAYHCVRIIRSSHVRLEGIRIWNRVNGNNDGFHFISAEHVAISNCVVYSQDDACALFGSCKFVTISNCVFSTRWSVFRFGGGEAEHIAISNCVLDQVFGCPIKFQGRPGDRFENISFSNLVFREVTGPIHLSLGPDRYGRRPGQPPAIARRISFSNIQGTVTTRPPPLPGYPFAQRTFPGEEHSCIVLNAVGGAVIEDVAFDGIQLTFGGGGTADEAARRKLPEIAGEYFQLGPMPAYGFYARNARGLTLANIRFQLAGPDLRPALILDHVRDAAIGGLSVQADPSAESALRFIDTEEVLLTAPRVLTRSGPFLQVEGAGNRAIKIDGGDLSKAASPLAFRDGAAPEAVALRI